jgi:hypothetical protein
VGAPVGPAGTIACARPRAEGESEPTATEAPPRARIGASFGWSAADLVLDEGADAEIERTQVVVSVDVFATETLTLLIASGALLQGTLDEGGIERQIGPGWLLAGGATWRVVDGSGAAPYVLLSLTFGATGTRTVADPPESAEALRGHYLGVDARFGVAVGKTFADVFSPYAAARAFGGPVVWSEGEETRGGTDRYHVQLAAGAALILRPFDVFVEGAPLGERALTAGVGASF